ncbi:hypothetical protein PLICRDRAFT_67830, partial [Plicaturopsis crispa FD-325 SS-3]
RARRWEEEVHLVKEEMRRVLQTLEYNAQTWLDRGASAQGLSPAHAEGLRAHAARQAKLQRDLRAHFSNLW